ncbi:MAG: type II toxin-antitoxin system VapC family toxin [Nitrososphaerota archaeon]
MKNLLFDASSLIYSLKKRNLKQLYNNYIQFLTIYEVINAIWRESYLNKAITIEEARELMSIFNEVIELMKMIDPHECEKEILEIAWELGITAYDASYIVLAKKHNLILVSEDEKLKRKVGKIIKIVSLKELS